MNCQISVEKLEEGGFVLDCNDGSQSVGIVCPDDPCRAIWELDLNDWISYAIDSDRRARRDEAERIKLEAEERQRLDAERLRLMEIERQAIEKRRAEEAERARLAEIERQERQRVADLERQERQRIENERLRQQEAERQKLLEVMKQQEHERMVAERARLEAEAAESARLVEAARRSAEAARLAVPPVPISHVLPGPPPSLSSPSRQLSPARVVSVGPNLGMPPPLVAPPAAVLQNLPQQPVAVSSSPPPPPLARLQSSGPVPQARPSQSAPGSTVVAIPQSNFPLGSSMGTLPSVALSPGRGGPSGIHQANSTNSPVVSRVPPPTISPRSVAIVTPTRPVKKKKIFWSDVLKLILFCQVKESSSVLPPVGSDASSGPRLPAQRAEKPPPWAATNSPPPSPGPSFRGSEPSSNIWSTANPRLFFLFCCFWKIELFRISPTAAAIASSPMSSSSNTIPSVAARAEPPGKKNFNEVACFFF